MNADKNILLTNARNILKSCTETLQKDVRHCIFHKNSTSDWPAPFPALLYCFSILDLLASLYNRNQSKKEKDEINDAIKKIKSLKISKELKDNAINGINYQVSENARKYMDELMYYPQLQINLLQKIFRNPLVHAGQPRPTVSHEGKKYTWRYYHKNRMEHLKIHFNKENDISVFLICIWSFTEDIVDSVFKPNGYLELLENNTNLQRNFNRKLKDLTNV